MLTQLPKGKLCAVTGCRTSAVAKQSWDAEAPPRQCDEAPPCQCEPALACCQVPRWTPKLHALFPRPLRLAIRELLLISRCRGFGGRGLDSAASAPAPAPVANTSTARAAASPASGTWLPLAPRHVAAGGSRSCSLQLLQPLSAADGFGAAPEPAEANEGPGQQSGPLPRQRRQEGAAVWLDANILECTCQHLARLWNQHD
jgi:hypothetical protein